MGSSYAFAHLQVRDGREPSQALLDALSRAGASAVPSGGGAFNGALLKPLGASTPPSYVAIAQDGAGLFRVALNSFNRFAETAAPLSAACGGSVWVALAESVSGTCYLALYESGQLAFEADALDGEDCAVHNPRELPLPWDDDGVSFDAMGVFAQGHGLALEFDADTLDWRIYKVDWPRATPAKPATRKKWWGLF